MAAPTSDDKVVMGGSYVLEAGETLPGNLIVIGGNATIEEGATVSGDVILLGGQVSVSGVITGNLNLIRRLCQFARYSCREWECGCYFIRPE